MYRRNFTRMKPWEKMKMWVDKGYLKAPPLFSIFKIHEYPHMIGLKSKNISNDSHLYIKFFKRYPETDNLPLLTALEVENPVTSIKSASNVFIDKQKRYMNMGYSEEKAFQLVEQEMSEILQKEKYERSLFEGLVTSNRSRSLMSYYEQQAEFETRQKLKQLQRIIPQYKRYQSDLEKTYDSLIRDKESEKDSEIMNNYEPATYIMSNIPDRDKTPNKILENFANRSERILKYFHSFSEIKDGISSLTDKEIILRAKETPQKLKDSYNRLLKKLEKFNVKLNSEGKIDYSKIDSLYVEFVKKQEKLITVLLLEKDLDFQIPHKLNRSTIKNNILKEIEEEEQRLAKINMTQQEQQEKERLEKQKRKLNYESYFEIPTHYEADIVKSENNLNRSSNIKKSVTYDEWVKENSKIFMFDNDLLYETYYYNEDPIDKETRLRELWIKSKKNNLEINTDEIIKLNESIASLVREIRRKIDQNLLKIKKHPIFRSNYRYYEEEEFMIDSDIEFHKIKKFLQSDVEVIKNDPEIGFRYEELLQVLKRKKIIESSVPMFGAENIDNYYDEKVKYDEDHDIEKVEADDGIVEAIGSLQEQMKRITSTYNSDELSSAKNMTQVDDKIQKAKEKIVVEFENILDKQNMKKKKNVKMSKTKKEMIKQTEKRKK